MLNTKLIFVDGISGSGKSTIAHYIARQLEKNGIKAKLVLETNRNHPLHAVYENYTEANDEYFQWLITEYPKHWGDFANKIKDDEYVYIVESYPFQNAIATLIYYDFDKQTIIKHVHNICSQTSILNPVLIHFVQNNTEQALRETWLIRGDWKKVRISKEEKSLFCMNRGLNGENASIAFWSEMADISRTIFDDLLFFKIQLTDSKYDWENCRKQILKFLDIKQFEEKLYNSSFEKYCAIYGGITVYVKDERLCLDAFWPNLKLIPLSSDEFELEGFPIVIKFIKDDKYEIKSLKIIKALSIYNENDEHLKITPVELSQDELSNFCGSYRCESEKLDREIYLKDNELYYLRTDGSESKLIPTSPTKLVMQGGSATLTFDIVAGIKQFILASPNQKDLIFIQTNS